MGPHLRIMEWKYKCKKYIIVYIYLLSSTLSSKRSASSSSVSCAYARQVSALSYSPRWRVMYAIAMKRTKSSKNFICSKLIFLYHVCALNISNRTMELDTTNSRFTAFLPLPVLIFFQGNPSMSASSSFCRCSSILVEPVAGIVLQCTCVTNQSQRACGQNHPKQLCYRKGTSITVWRK